MTDQIIKFRAWDTVDKKIRTVTNINWFDELVYMDEHPDGTGIRRRLSEIVLLQYTGLKDKNRVDIFKGDIVDYTGSDIPGDNHNHEQVEWLDEYPGWGLLAYGMGLNQFYQEDIEVIGNIYEHSELLEQADE